MTSYFPYISFVLFTIGAISTAIGLWGMIKFHDFYQKIHAASVIDSFGIPLALLGCAFLADSPTSVFKIITLIVLIILLGPVNSYILARSALSSKAGRYLPQPKIKNKVKKVN